MQAGIALVLLVGTLPAQTIRGTMTDTSGRPVSGATVEAFAGAEPSTRTVLGARIASAPIGKITDRDGNYAFTHLAPGVYYVKALRESESVPYRLVRVDDGVDVTVNIVVPANPTLSGRVLNADGEGVANVRISLVGTELRSGMLVRVVMDTSGTQKDGSYTFESGLEPNRHYYVRADRNIPKELPLDRREAIDVPTYFPAATDLDSAVSVVLQAGEHREKVDIKLARVPFHCVDGRIQGAGPYSVQEEALVGTPLVRTAVTPAAGGEYKVCGLPSGAYRVAGRDGFAPFTIGTADLHHVDAPPNTARLHLVVDWDSPRTPALDAFDPETPRKFAAALGIPNDAGLSDLVRRLGRGIDATASDVGDLAVLLGQSSDDTAKQVNETAARVLSPLLSLSIFFGTGPLFTTVLVLHPLSVNAKVPSERDIPMSPGDYALDFGVVGRITVYPKEITLDGVPLADRLLRIAPGSSGTLHIVVATDVASVAVTVTDALGNGVPNAMVMLAPESATSPAALSRLAVRGRTDQNGHFSSPALTPGKYRALATSQTVRWSVPEDLERVALVLPQATALDLDPKAKAQVALVPVVVY